MLSSVKTSAIHGIDAIPVDVEVNVSSGWPPKFNIVGLGDNAVRESRERVSSAVRQSGFRMPDRVVVNLAPAELKKEGSYFDLAIALAVVAAGGDVKSNSLAHTKFYGELSLDGGIKPVRGMVAFTIEALRNGTKSVVVPRDNVPEAQLINGIEVMGVRSLAELVGYLNGNLSIEQDRDILNMDLGDCSNFAARQLSDVWGQKLAKRAMLITAAGGHNLLMVGPPGCGKSMLAQRFSSILPPMTREETLEVVRIHSIAGLPIVGFLKGERPFRAPHHIVSDVGLVGGGSVPKPGEISLAHRGVLFLDEFPEYRRTAIEALRAPLENGEVRVTRAKGSLNFPANFQLIAAMNPCPCGRLGVPGTTCLCSLLSIQGYLRKLSQPILDRIDLHVELEPVPFSALGSGRDEESRSSEEEGYRSIVLAARERQYKRSAKLNSALEGSEITKFVTLSKESAALLEKAAQKLGLSARTYIRVLKVALTIADIEGDEHVAAKHIAEALSFRTLERLKQYCEGR